MANDTSEKRIIPPEELVAGLVRLLDVQPTGDRLFRGARLPGGRGRVFGGQVIGQSLMAATKTVDPGRPVHSLHAYFMRPGDEDYPIDYRVEADFDGGSFSNRRVVALQNGMPILNLVASFQRKEGGLHHAVPMPEVTPPEELVSHADYVRANPEGVPPFAYRVMTRPNPFEFRTIGVPAFLSQEPREPVMYVWFRSKAPLQGGPEIRRAILALVTDFALLSTSLLPHGVSWTNRTVQTASIDHALWLHEDDPLDGWMLYTTDSPWSGGARGFSRGMIFNRAGRLVASVAQEGLIRLRD